MAFAQTEPNSCPFCNGFYLAFDVLSCFHEKAMKALWIVQSPTPIRFAIVFKVPVEYALGRLEVIKDLRSFGKITNLNQLFLGGFDVFLVLKINCQHHQKLWSYEWYIHYRGIYDQYKKIENQTSNYCVTTTKSDQWLQWWQKISNKIRVNVMPVNVTNSQAFPNMRKQIFTGFEPKLKWFLYKNSNL